MRALSRLRNDCLFLGCLQQTVAAIVTAIQDVYGVGVAIDVGEEVMTKQVDLNQGLFFGEGLENQFLHAYYFVISGKLLHQTIDVELGASLGGSVCDLLVDDAGLVFAELAQNFSSGNVNCGVHVLVGFFYADDVAACAHGNLALSGGGVSRILFDLQYNLGSKGVDVHDLHGVADFFFGISADGIRDGHPAAGALALHVLVRGAGGEIEGGRLADGYRKG